MLKREASHCHYVISWQRTLWKSKEVECVFFHTVENNRTGWGVKNNLFQELPAGKLRGNSILLPSDLRCLVISLCLPRCSTLRALWVGSVRLQQCKVWTASSRQCHKCTQRFARNKACVWYIQSVSIIEWKKTQFHWKKNQTGKKMKGDNKNYEKILTDLRKRI